MSNVLIVPETEDFKLHVSHHNIVWVTKKLGVPRLEQQNASYFAPFWIGENEGVNRIYHIREVRDNPENTEYTLGNSFVLDHTWTDIGQRRRFEYRSLSIFGLREQEPGILVPIVP
ncbi:MAG: hypothetical protein ACRYFS_06100 [Janthinobacterium lividum]